MSLPPILAGVRERPGMYMQTVTYDTVVAFVLGYDLAIHGGLLWTFHEWLVPQVNGGNNQAVRERFWIFTDGGLVRQRDLEATIIHLGQK
jgi:hypothetical protein